LLVFLLWNSEATAQTPYFQGKTIRIIVGYPAGSSHDPWARRLSPNFRGYSR
jgi:tripartite-type tricarboxylate transporter receptor subunit TctC